MRDETDGNRNQEAGQRGRAGRVARYAFGALMLAVLAAGAVIFTLPPERGPWTLDPADPRVTLEDVEREVIRRFPVADISVSTLARMKDTQSVTLFDVRTREEFEAGHLPGAIRIEPGSSAEEILREHRNRFGDQPVVFYCAVGVRSSQVLMETLDELAPLTRAPLYNLRGGVFRWTAEGRPLSSEDGPGRPHPYNGNWGRLLKRTIPDS